MLLAVLATLLLLSGAAYVAVGAAAAKPDITVQISPASQSVEAGKTTTYTVTLTSTGGFEGTVALSGQRESQRLHGQPPAGRAQLDPQWHRLDRHVGPERDHHSQYTGRVLHPQSDRYQRQGEHAASPQV